MLVHLLFGSQYLSVTPNGSVVLVSTNPGATEAFDIRMPDGNSAAPFQLLNGHSYQLRSLSSGALLLFDWVVTGSVVAAASPGVPLIRLVDPSLPANGQLSFTPATIAISSPTSLPVNFGWLTSAGGSVAANVIAPAPGPAELLQMVVVPCVNSVSPTSASVSIGAAASGAPISVPVTVSTTNPLPVGSVTVQLSAASPNGSATVPSPLLIPAGSTTLTTSISVTPNVGTALVVLNVTAGRPGLCANGRTASTTLTLATASAALIAFSRTVGKACGTDITSGGTPPAEFTLTSSATVAWSLRHVDGAGGCPPAKPVTFKLKLQGATGSDVTVAARDGVLAPNGGLASARGFLSLGAGTWILDPTTTDWTPSYGYQFDILTTPPNAGALPNEKRSPAAKVRGS